MYEHGTSSNFNSTDIGYKNIFNTSNVIVGTCSITLQDTENNETRDIPCTSWIYEDSAETIISKVSALPLV